jgi:hypothetical protein
MSTIVDPEKKRIGVALVQEGSARDDGPASSLEAEDVRDDTARADVGSTEGFGSLADKLRGALKPRDVPLPARQRAR